MKKNIGLFFICLAGIFLRLYNLGKVNLWVDEIITAARAKSSLVYMLKDIEWTPSPPLYYIIMNFWVKIFGVSAISLRLPSVIFSALSVFFIFKLTKELYGEKAAFLSASLLSVYPYAINYAQEAKQYSMLWFFGILSFFYFYKFIKNNNPKNLLAYVACATVAIYTMYTGFIFIFIHNIFFLLVNKTKKIKLWLGGQLLIFLFFLPWIYRFFYHLTHSQEYLKWIPKTQDYFSALIFAFRAVLGDGIGKGSWIELCIYIVLVISAVIMFKNIRPFRIAFDFKKEEGLLFAWVFIPVLIFYLIDAFILPIFASGGRYFGFVHIPLIVLFGKGLNRYDYKFAKIKLKFIILSILLLSIFSNHLYPYYKYGLKLNRDNFVKSFKKGSEWLDKNMDKDSLFVNVNVLGWILQYFDLEQRLTPIKSLEQKTVMPYKSVFLMYCFLKKENKDELIQSITKKLRMYVYEDFYFGNAGNGQFGSIWLKKMNR